MTDEPMKVEKRGFVMHFPEIHTDIYGSMFPRKGRTVEVPLTDEDRAEHARAVELLDELYANKWIYDGHEGPELMDLKPDTEFIPEETEDEWRARWEAAGEPRKSFFDVLFERGIDG